MEIIFTLEDAVSAHEAGDLATAIVLYRDLLVQDAARPDILTNLGIALCQSGSTSAGIESLERAVSLSEGDPVALYNLGYALLENAQCAEAMSVLTRAAHLSPDDLEIKDALVQASRCLPDRATATPGTGPTTVPSAPAEMPGQQTTAPESPASGNDELPQAPPAIRGREKRTTPPSYAHQDWYRISEHLDILERIYRSHGFDEKLRGLKDKRQDLLDPSIYVFIIGEGKFGKSSLINHLLGIKVAQTGKLPKTWRVDLYRPAPDGQEFAELTRYGGGTPELLSIDDASKICDDQEPEILERVNAAKLVSEGDDQNLVAADGQVIQVDWSRVGLALDSRMTLVDTPGFAQPRGRASARADALRRSEGVAIDIDDISDFYYHRSDLVLWAFKATKLEDADTLENLELLSRETKRILGVLTHWDQVDEADRAGRLREARKRYGSYVSDFVCVDCKGAPGVPREGVLELRDWLRGEADRAAVVKLESARAYCSDQARFAAQWLESLGDSLVRNVAEVAMYSNGTSHVLLRNVAGTRDALMKDIDDRVSASDEAGILGILTSGGTQEQKQKRISKFMLVSGLNERLKERLRADGHHLSVQGSNLARQRKLQQVVIKGRGASEYRSLQAHIDPPLVEGLTIGLSGVSVPSVASGFMDSMFDIFQGTWIGGVAEFFGGRSSAERQEEAIRKAVRAIHGALQEQVQEAVTAFTKAGAEAILAGVNSGITRAYPGRDLTALRQYARLIDEQMLLLKGIDPSITAVPRFESHYMLWSPVDDGRQIVLALFCAWFETQQTRVKQHITPWGAEALEAHPLPVLYVYDCVRNMIAESKQWFQIAGAITLAKLVSARDPSLNVANLLAPNSWAGEITANVRSRDPFLEGTPFLKQVFPGLPDHAFHHFRLGGLGYAFSDRFAADFSKRCQKRFKSSGSLDVVAETGNVKFSPGKRLMTKSCVGVTACAAVFAGFSSSPWASWHIVPGTSLPSLLAKLYLSEFHGFLQSAWAAGRASVAVLSIQYLFFLCDKRQCIEDAVTIRASQALRQVCIDAWRDVTEAFGPAYVRSVASEYTLVGMRPLDYARDGLLEKYQTDVLDISQDAA